MGFCIYEVVIGRAGGTRDSQMKDKQVRRGKKILLSVSSSLLQEKEVSDRQGGSVVSSFTA